MNIEDLRQRMGAQASTAEAERMARLLRQRGITEAEQIAEVISDREFFALIPECVQEEDYKCK
jgi:hypothetical protein